jgi:hypothetical protein
MVKRFACRDNNGGGIMMEPFAVSVMPIAKPDEWRAFADEIAHGERTEAHREMLRRLGVKREHIRVQPTPDGGHLMVLVWEGVDQEQVGELMGDLLQNPRSDHERYVVEHVVPNLHGIDLSSGPPPMMETVSRIEA